MLSSTRGRSLEGFLYDCIRKVVLALYSVLGGPRKKCRRGKQSDCDTALWARRATVIRVGVGPISASAYRIMYVCRAPQVHRSQRKKSGKQAGIPEAWSVTSSPLSPETWRASSCRDHYQFMTLLTSAHRTCSGPVAYKDAGPCRPTRNTSNASTSQHSTSIRITLAPQSPNL